MRNQGQIPSNLPRGCRTGRLALWGAFIISTAWTVLAQDAKPGQPAPALAAKATPKLLHSGSSPFDPPATNDTTFVVDVGPGLDTGCTYRSGGPLVFDIYVTRVVGDVAKLQQNGLISATAVLQMPAWDVDYDTPVSAPYSSERDEVYFNGQLVSGKYLTGINNEWVMNSFEIPITNINFPADPGPGGTVVPAKNTVSISIDVANAALNAEEWCTAIDWAALSFSVARPVVMVHGIFSDGSAWNKTGAGEMSWTAALAQRGLPSDNGLSMGALDSIQNNAQKIHDEVAATRQRWGVDKVNLVCHSKGGLDARHYVELLGRDSVDKLIQLGTPNAGSPLADFAQGVLVRFLGVLPTAIINGLAGPAGVQLTTPYMALYDYNHGYNPAVRYTALAGYYHPPGFFSDPVDNLLAAIVGPGDTIVPVTSVHALPYTENLLYESSEANQQAMHTHLNSSPEVFDLVFGGLAGQTSAQSVMPKNTSAALVRTESAAGAISQGQVQQQFFPIDAATQTFVSLTYPTGQLSLVLISPSNQRFDATSIAGSTNVFWIEKEIPGGLMAGFCIATPEVGVWTAEVTGTAVPGSGTVGYAVTAWLSGPAISFAAGVATNQVFAGDTLRLLGTLQSGASPLLGATVTATLALPDGSSQTVTLHDDGLAGDATAADGIYTADFTGTTQAGNYRIVFSADKIGAGASPTFSREATGLATVSRRSAQFNGQFADSGLDTDHNGFYDYLVLTAGVTVNNAATFLATAVLADSQGNPHYAAAQADLAPGTTNLSFQFNGGEFFGAGVNGPYSLTSIRLEEVTALDFLPLQLLTNAYTTATYGYVNFQGSKLSLTGQNTATGVDTDANGRFDRLDTTVGVNVSIAGSYTWSARLLDQEGTILGAASGSGALAVGTNTLTLSFEGSRIGTNNAFGPYWVSDLLVYSSSQSLIVARVFQTPAYQPTQFEGGTFHGAPDAVTGLIASSTAGFIGLSWTGGTNTDWAYWIYRATSAWALTNVAGLTPIATLSFTSPNGMFDDLATVPGKPYYYAVAVVDAQTNMSALSPIVVGTNLVAWPPAATNALGSAVQLCVTAALSTNSLSYQWYANGQPLLDQGLVTGSQSACLMLGGVTASADYTVILSNIFGAVTSPVAHLEVVPPVPALKYTSRTFNGLYYPLTGAAATNSGAISLSVSPGGRFSGLLRSGLGLASFSGTFDGWGRAAVTVRPSGAPRVTLTLALQIDTSAPISRLTGTVAQGAAVSGIYAYVGGPGPQAPARGQKTYTLAMPPGSVIGASVSPHAAAGSSRVPGGWSVATATMDNQGGVTLVGTLADGTAFSEHMLTSKGGNLPVFASLYGGKGVLVGWVQFTNDVPTGQWLWLKPAGIPNQPSYPAGFALSSQLLGSLYVKPAGVGNQVNLQTGVSLIEGGDLGNTSTANPPVAKTLVGNTLVGYFTMVRNQAVFTNNPNHIILTFSPGQGQFSGSFVSPVTRQVTALHGVVFQQQRVAFGWFVSGNRGGAVILE